MSSSDHRPTRKRKASAASSSVSPPPKTKRKGDGGRTFIDQQSPFSTGATFGTGTPWPHHADSDDSDAYESSDSDGPPSGHSRLYRALRDSDQPFKQGLKGGNSRARGRTVAQHVQGGGKSPFISLTTKKRKAVKWSRKASKDNKPRVATIDLPSSTPVVDLSDKTAATRVGLGRTGANFARSSSEVVVRGPIAKQHIRRVEAVEKHTKKSKAEGRIVKTRVHTGTSKSRAKPQAFRLVPENKGRKT